MKVVPCYNVIQNRIKAEFTIALQVVMFIEYKYQHTTKDKYNFQLKNRHHACKHTMCTSMNTLKGPILVMHQIAYHKQLKLKVTLYKTVIIYTTVGILAGIRPCGTIVLLAELFTAESKSQVYAHLHEFLRINPSVAEKLGRFTCACIS